MTVDFKINMDFVVIIIQLLEVRELEPTQSWCEAKPCHNLNKYKGLSQWPDLEKPREERGVFVFMFTKIFTSEKIPARHHFWTNWKSIITELRVEEKFPKFLTLNLLVHNESLGRDIYDLSQYRIHENKQIPWLVVCWPGHRAGWDIEHCHLRVLIKILELSCGCLGLSVVVRLDMVEPRPPR